MRLSFPFNPSIHPHTRSRRRMGIVTEKSYQGNAPASGAIETPEIVHRWEFCALCGGWTTICGKCGNNCCNGGYGTLADGSTCDACPSAYAFQERITRTPEGSAASTVLTQKDV